MVAADSNRKDKESIIDEKNINKGQNEMNTWLGIGNNISSNNDYGVAMLVSRFDSKADDNK